MAIFGIGSMWDDEMKDDFFQDNNFVIGWDYFNAKDIYEAVSLLKAGDIIYLKANRPGSRTIRVKAIGVVAKSFVHYFIENRLQSTNIADWNNFSIPIHWIVKEEFQIIIPPLEGRLTNVRAATFYEEFLPYVQQQILAKLFNLNIDNEKTYFMDFGLGQFITGVLSVGLQVLQMWREGRNVKEVQDKIKQFDEIASSLQILEEGQMLEGLIPNSVLVTLRGRVEICWTDFNEAVASLNITPNQLDRYSDGLKECICRELKVIKRLHGNLPTRKMQDWWDGYKCPE